ncbi:MAG: YggS family pyridoxal phosphate-dependent enzyme [Candidatus Omnitrophota bacterium]|nr:YggS family pyridoxal phosphate-dependent enzyme [Candidatus Omnitrophota bacterium]
MIPENSIIVRSRIKEAAGRAGRRADDIILVCVTKTVGVPQIEEALAAGAADIGESRVQDAEIKFKAIGARAKWHLIGHLQTNKVKDAVRIFDLIHSVDSLKLAEEISKRAGVFDKTQEILVEVKTSEEATKYGAATEEVLDLVEKAAALPHIKIMGLMTMAPVVSDAEEARPYFKRLREISEAIAAKKIDNVNMRYLSMGMTQDFEIAIEEGANMVRVGHAIFEG